MILNIPLLALGLLLLWFPRQWMRHGVAFLRRRRRDKSTSRIVEPWRQREAGDPRVGWRTEFTKLRNYIDLLRGAAGSLVLFGGMGIAPMIAADTGASPGAIKQVMVIRAAILFVGLVIQTVRYERYRLSFYPPIFYLAGLSVGLCDIRGALFAFVLIWAINGALPNAQGFLSVYSLLLVVFGHLFAWRGDLRAVFAGILCFTPVLLSLLTRRPLMIFSRKSAHVS
jgi:hypothetical protein